MVFIMHFGIKCLINAMAVNSHKVLTACGDDVTLALGSIVFMTKYLEKTKYIYAHTVDWVCNQ